MQKRHKALFTVAFLFGITLVAVVRMGTPKIDNTLPASLSLPRVVGDWKGSVPLFCQNKSCLHSITDFKDGIIPDICPECSGVLNRMSLAELQILPQGTKISKMNYRHGSHKILVSVVITGDQRSGIHRPQWCLPSQGLIIRKSKIIKHEIGLGHKLPLNLLTVTPRGRESGGGIFAYWFVDKEHEIATHWQRLFWMAYNDLILGVRRPWAYVSIWMPSGGDTMAIDRILSFIDDLYPHLNSGDSVKVEN